MNVEFENVFRVRVEDDRDLALALEWLLTEARIYSRRPIGCGPDWYEGLFAVDDEPRIRAWLEEYAGRLGKRLGQSIGKQAMAEAELQRVLAQRDELALAAMQQNNGRVEAAKRVKQLEAELARIAQLYSSTKLADDIRAVLEAKP